MSFTIDHLKSFNNFQRVGFEINIGKLAQVHNGKEAIHFIIEKFGPHNTKKYGDGMYVKGAVQTFPCKSGEVYAKGDIFFCRIKHIDRVYG